MSIKMNPKPLKLNGAVPVFWMLTLKATQRFPGAGVEKDEADLAVRTQLLREIWPFAS